MVAALEEGRRAGGSGLRSWEGSIIWFSANSDGADAATTSKNGRINLVPQLSTLAEYLSLSILEPPSLHDDIHPAPVAASTSSASTTPPSKGGKAGKGKAPPPALVSADQTPTAVDEDLAAERWARYRVGGLLGLSWMIKALKDQNLDLPDEIRLLLRNSLLWTALASDSPEDEEVALGFRQPTIRRAAYQLLSTLMETYPTELEHSEMLDTVAHAVLHHCWFEEEAAVWEVAGPTIAKFLSIRSTNRNSASSYSRRAEYRQSWDLTSARDSGETEPEGEATDDATGDAEHEYEEGDDKDENDDIDGPEEEEDAENTAERSIQAAALDQHPSLSPFLNFISSACPAIPHLTYPLLLVVVSTMPESVLPLQKGLSNQLQNFFSHLLSPVDARAMSTHSLPGQASAFQTLLRTAVDCIIYLAGKASQSEEGAQTAEWLVTQQLGERVWSEGVLGMGGRAVVRRSAPNQRSEEEALMVGSALSRVAAIRGPEALTALVQQIDNALVEACFAPPSSDRRAQPVLGRSLDILQALKDACAAETAANELDTAFVRIFERAVEMLATDIQERDEQGRARAEILSKMLRSKWCPVSPEDQAVWSALPYTPVPLISYRN